MGINTILREMEGLLGMTNALTCLTDGEYDDGVSPRCQGR